MTSNPIRGMRQKMQPGTIAGNLTNSARQGHEHTVKELALALKPYIGSASSLTSASGAGGGGGGGGPFPFRVVGGTPGRKPLASEELFNAPMLLGDTLPAGLTDSALECEVAPTSSWTLTLYQNGASIGTGTILAGATTGSFTFAADVTFAANDSWSASCPAVQDATCSGISYRFVGTET